MRKAFIAGGAFWLLPLTLLCQLPYQLGWPVGVTGYLTSPIAIADIDDDGQNELVVSDSQPGGSLLFAKLYVFAIDGNLKPGWPIEKASSYNAPAIADINDDGKLEMLSIASGIHLYTADGTLLWEHLYTGPIFQGIYGPSNATIADIDNDGNLELVVACGLGQAVFVFDAQGNVRPGWPVILGNSSTSASIGDIDNDGLKEILISTALLNCLKPDGSACPGFPFDPGVPGRAKPVLIDYNNDGYLEIVYSTRLNSSVYVVDHNGQIVPPYPIPLNTVFSISTGDINADGSKEIAWCSSGVKVYDLASASLWSGFPASDPDGIFLAGGLPVLASVGDEPGQEITVGEASPGFVSDGKVISFDVNGIVAGGFPSAVLFHRYPNACTVNDLDGDGDIEICCGSENNEFVVPRSSTVYCWDSPHPYNLDNVDWAMDGFDLGHTGRWRKLFHINKVLSPLSLVPCQGQGNPCYLPPDGSLIAVDVTAIRQFGGANPSGQDVRYSRTLGCGNYEGPVIDNGNGTYRRMLRAPLATCTTDVHAWVNEFKLADYQQIVFTNSCFQPPDAFNLLSPPNHAANRPLTVTLSWQAVGTFPNAPTGYDLYFGPNPNPPLYAAALAGTQYTVSGLDLATTYFWQVVAKNACGDTPSAVWSFKTVPCTLSPRPFNYLSPPDEAVDQPLDIELAWESSTQASSYQVYLGTDPDALSLVSMVHDPRSTLHDLSESTTYYWKVVAINACGTREGAVWSFTTLSLQPTVLSLFVPAVARTPGANGTLWRTDGMVFNPGDVPATYTLTLHQAEGGWRKAEGDGGENGDCTGAVVGAGLSPLSRGRGFGDGLNGGRVRAGVRDGGNPPLRSDSVLDLHAPRTTIHGPRLLLTLEPGQSLFIQDMVGTLFGLDEAAGSLELQSDQPLILTTRTYTETEEGTFGQFVPAMAMEDAIGVEEQEQLKVQILTFKVAPAQAEYVGAAMIPTLRRENSAFASRRSTLHDPRTTASIGHLIGLKQNAEYRTNIGFAEITGQATDVSITVFDLSGSQLLATGYQLPAWGWLQVGLAELGISNLDMGRAEVEVTSGGAVLSYASVADNRTGDAVFLPAQKSGKTEQIVAAVARTPGAYNTLWRSDGVLFNPGDGPAAYRFTFHAGFDAPHRGAATNASRSGRVRAWVRDEGNPPLRSDFILEPGQSLFIQDLVGTLFGIENAAGSLGLESDQPLIFTTRTYNETTQGTYGQSVPAMGTEDAIGESSEAFQVPGSKFQVSPAQPITRNAKLETGGAVGHILQLANTEEYRTNLGFAEAAGLEMELEIRIYDLSGSLLLTTGYRLPSTGWRQVSLEALGLSMTLPAARAEVTVLSGGAVYAYASVVDNRTGDAIFVPAQ